MFHRLRHRSQRKRLHVQVTGSGEVRVRFPGFPSLPFEEPSTWVEVTVKRETNAPINEDVWRIYEAYECSRLGNTFTRLHGGSPICSAGQWEVAIYEHGEADFMGGLHGDETFSAAALVVDGTARNLSVAWSGWAHRACFAHTSVLQRVGGGANLADRRMTVTFTGDGFDVSQLIVWLADLSLDYCYLAMLPVVRKIGTEQITHTAKRSPSYAAEDVSEAGFTEALSTTSNVVRVYGDNVWTQIECTHREIVDDGDLSLPPGTIGAQRWEKVSNAVAYNKVYMSIAGKGAAAPEGVGINDHLWTTTRYQIRTDGGP